MYTYIYREREVDNNETRRTIPSRGVLLSSSGTGACQLPHLCTISALSAAGSATRAFASSSAYLRERRKPQRVHFQSAQEHRRA